MSVSLKEIGEINKRMHLVLSESRHLYRVSLNAMFASRKISVGVEGFIEVTGLLRDFSSRLDQQVNMLATSVSILIYNMATLSKLTRKMALADKAFSLIKRRYKMLYVEDEYQHLVSTVDELIVKISVEVERSLKLTGIGGNLTILAKVEASSVPEEVNDLDTITNDMEDIIVNINKVIAESRYFIAA